MAVEIKMPALSPTMEHGTLAKWLIKVGDSVSSGDLMAEIETDKATMEFEAVDEGVVTELLVAAGTENVQVGTVIARISSEGDTVVPEPNVGVVTTAVAAAPLPSPSLSTPPIIPPVKLLDGGGNRIKASPLARRVAVKLGVDLANLHGTGPNGRLVKADIDNALVAAPVDSSIQTPMPNAKIVSAVTTNAAGPEISIPHTIEKLSGMRKTIARRLAEAKQTIPHIYLTVDIQLDKMLKLRAELNSALEGQGIKLSVNDLLIKALAKALIAVPKCNVSFAGDSLITYTRADISVAVSVPAGLITPIITDAGSKSVSAISTEIKALADKAKAGKLQPHEFQGGTASLSNMGMFGIKHFEAIINPPQAMIMAIGAGEKRPFVIDDALQIATIMSATGSFDHRAIDGADGAQLMKAFKDLCESPLGLLA